MASAENDVVFKRGEDLESDAWDDTVLIKAYDNAISEMKAKLAEQHPEFSSPQADTKLKNNNKKKSKTKKKHKQQKSWHVGDLCQAKYSVDGELYDAKILSINCDKRTCILQYVDYGNEEEHKLLDLLPPLSALSTQEHHTDTASESEGFSKVNNTHNFRCGKQKQRRSHSSHYPHQPYSSKEPWNYGYPPYMPPFSHFQHPHSFPGFHPSGSTSVPSYQQTPFSGFQMPGPPSSQQPVFPCVPPPPPPLFAEGSSEVNEALYSMLISWYMSGYHTGFYQGLKQSSNNSAASGQGFPR